MYRCTVEGILACSFGFRRCGIPTVWTRPAPLPRHSETLLWIVCTVGRSTGSESSGEVMPRASTRFAADVGPFAVAEVTRTSAAQELRLGSRLDIEVALKTTAVHLMTVPD